MFASIAAPASGWLFFAALAPMTAKRLTEACSYAALIGLAAAIRRLLRTGLAAVVHSYPCNVSVCT